MFTIKRAAEITGVSEATLRAWERRYGVIAPLRTESGYRLYDEDALACIRQMQALIEAGWSPKQASERLAATGRATRAVSTDPQLAESIDAFIAAAEAMDTAGVNRVITDVFASVPFETAIDGWLTPVLRTIGERWHSGELTIAAEHLAAQAILVRLTGDLQAAATRGTGPRIVIGLGPGSRHELGVLAFATAARRCGLDVLYLGADLPAADWVQAVERHRAVGIILAVPLPTDVPAAREVIAAVRSGHPDIWVGVGGTYQDDVDATATPLGHDIAAAARMTANTLIALEQEGDGR